jgi:hypothetical protein
MTQSRPKNIRPLLAIVFVGVALVAVVALVLAALANWSSHKASGSDIAGLGSLPGARFIRLPAGAPTSKRTFIDRMTIHHTESGATVGGQRVDAKLVGLWHVQRGLNEGYGGAQASAYHFVILPDGTVQAGRPLNARGSGTKNLLDNGRSIGVVLVGDFSSKTNHGQTWPSRPTAAQTRSLTKLALWAFATFHFGPSNVHGHREVGASDCPGDRVDLNALRAHLAAAQASGQKGIAPPIVLVR